ncbi:MAG: hypothetical protein QM749_05565 [Aquabacterium sp.]
MQATHAQVKAHLNALYDDLVGHEGFAELSVDIRILKRGQKEVVIRCGRQYRYVVGVEPVAGRPPRDMAPSE